MSQYGTMGWDQQPADDASIEVLPSHGELNDMSGGYAVGDTVRNFIAYDVDGNAVDLYAKLAGPRPVIVANGSVTCPRFRDIFDEDVSSAEFTVSRNFILEHADDFEWVFIYGAEAHPTEGACPSNCPPVTTTDTTVVQAASYGQRRAAVNTWNTSDHIAFPFTFYADNPDNSIYNTYFERPSGWVALNCDGTVARRGDWLMFSFINPAIQADLLEWRSGYQVCTIDWEPPVPPVDPGPSAQLSGAPGTVALGTNDVTAEGALVYPNPTSGEVFISVEEPAQLLLWNAIGQPVTNALLMTGRNALDLGGLPAGVYTAVISTPTSRSVHRLVKRN
jgi:hypothetical protein